jgi:V8-like Glu-specific endopeptidase
MLTQRGLRPIGRGAWAAPFESIAPRVVARYGGADAEPDATATTGENQDWQIEQGQSAAVSPRAPASRPSPSPSGGGTPLLFNRWERDIRAVAATRLTSARPLAVAIFPRIAGLDYRMETAGGGAVLTALTTRVGERFLAPRPQAMPVGARVSGAAPAPEVLQGFRPAHVAQRGTPAPLPRELERLTVRLAAQRSAPRVAGWDGAEPLHVFPPDTRRVFSDTSYPWSACGLIPEVGASGAMIGPRHMLTAAHALNITGGNLAAMSFVPLSFDGHPPPFGSANVTRAYYFTRTTTNTITDQQVAFDYAVCVLDRRLGDLTGWLGSRTYASSWNGGAYFAHVGYPFDIAGGRRPVFHGPGVIDSCPSESFGGRTGLRLLHQNDIEPGDSGGPFFGWWSGSPYIIGVQSGHDAATSPPYTPNLAAGGAPLVELIQYAINANP